MGFIKQGIVSTQFFLYGKKHFTQTGYLKHVAQYKDPVQSAVIVDANDPKSDGVDLTGKVFMVTGANQGVSKIACMCMNGCALYNIMANLLNICCTKNTQRIHKTTTNYRLEKR